MVIKFDRINGVERRLPLSLLKDTVFNIRSFWTGYDPVNGDYAIIEVVRESEMDNKEYWTEYYTYSPVILGQLRTKIKPYIGRDLISVKLIVVDGYQTFV